MRLTRLAHYLSLVRIRQRGPLIAFGLGWIWLWPGLAAHLTLSKAWRGWCIMERSIRSSLCTRRMAIFSPSMYYTTGHQKCGFLWRRRISSVCEIWYGKPVEVLYLNIEHLYYKKTHICICNVCNVPVKGGRYSEDVKCAAFLRHKQFVCSPQWLIKHNVKVYTLVQQPNQYVIVKPGVLHWGYNAGPNTAEAVNFALSSHKHEIADSPGYAFLVCKSGIGKGKCKCAAGQKAGVAEIYVGDLSYISDNFCTPRTTKDPAHNARKRKPFTHKKGQQKKQKIDRPSWGLASAPSGDDCTASVQSTFYWSHSKVGHLLTPNCLLHFGLGLCGASWFTDRSFKLVVFRCCLQ